MSERATARRRTAEERQPDYVVRARQGRGWQHVGVGWKRSNGEGISIKLNTIPINFDGVLKVLLPLEEEDEGHDPRTGELRG